MLQKRNNFSVHTHEILVFIEHLMILNFLSSIFKDYFVGQWSLFLLMNTLPFLYRLLMGMLFF